METHASVEIEIISRIAFTDDLPLEEFLAQCGRLNHESVFCVAEERALTGICGYPMCSNQLPSNIPKQSFTIEGRDILDAKERFKFCKLQCYRFMCHIRGQLPAKSDHNPKGSPHLVELLPEHQLKKLKPELNFTGSGENDTLLQKVNAGKQRLDMNASRTLIVREAHESDESSTDDEIDDSIPQSQTSLAASHTLAKQLSHGMSVTQPDSDEDMRPVLFGTFTDALEGWTSNRGKYALANKCVSGGSCKPKPVPIIDALPLKTKCDVKGQKKSVENVSVREVKVRWQVLNDVMQEWVSVVGIARNKEDSEELSTEQQRVLDLWKGEGFVKDTKTDIVLPFNDDLHTNQIRKNLFMHNVIHKLSKMSANLGLDICSKVRPKVDEFVLTADNLALNSQELQVSAAVFCICLTSPENLKLVQSDLWRNELKPFPKDIEFIMENMKQSIEIIRDKFMA